MSYTVKEIFYTLQGEGYHAGRPAVFLRFSGCNLWSGREQDRSTATCQFCDTDFLGGEKFRTASQLASAVENAWKGRAGRFVVCTGGEPLLQLDEALLKVLHHQGFNVAVETNGTIAALKEIDWVCVSPKAGAKLVQNTGNELKLVFPQPDAMPEQFENLKFVHFFLQPMDGPNLKRNTDLAIEYCLKNTQWRLSTQTQKLMGIR